MSKIWVNLFFEPIWAVLFAFSLRDGVEMILNYGIIQTTPEYTIPENFVKIGQIVSENEGE